MELGSCTDFLQLTVVSFASFEDSFDVTDRKQAKAEFEILLPIDWLFSCPLRVSALLQVVEAQLVQPQAS